MPRFVTQLLQKRAYCLEVSNYLHCPNLTVNFDNSMRDLPYDLQRFALLQR